MFTYSEEAAEYAVESRPVPQRSKLPQRYSPRFERRSKQPSLQRGGIQRRGNKRSGI